MDCSMKIRRKVFICSTINGSNTSINIKNNHIASQTVFSIIWSKEDALVLILSISSLFSSRRLFILSSCCFLYFDKNSLFSSYSLAIFSFASFILLDHSDLITLSYTAFSLSSSYSLVTPQKYFTLL